MLTPNWTRLVIALAALAAVAAVWLSGGHFDINAARAVVTASSVVVLGLLAYDRWAWRWRLVHRLTTRPVLHGTWKAELRTSFAGRADETIECFIVVFQTYSRICIDFLFEGSSSRSMSGDLVTEGGRCTLYYLFHTQADALHRDGNPPARGGAALVVSRRPRTHLEGDYWTERETRGSVRTVGHNAKRYDAFDAARRAVYS